MRQAERLEIYAANPNYSVTDHGRVYSHISNRYLIANHQAAGYPKVELFHMGKGTFQNVHRMVAETFLANPLNKPAVNHLDGNRANNHYTNLEWVTFSENTRHAQKTGLLVVASGVAKPNYKVTPEKRDQICAMLLAGKVTQKAIALRFGVSQALISMIKYGVR